LPAAGRAVGGVGGFDGDGAAGVDHPDVDALPGDDERATTADAPLHPHRIGCRDGWRAGGASVADTGHLGRGERVGQAAQQAAIIDELKQALVEADGHPPTGEVVADRVLPAGRGYSSTSWSTPD
jgi:hypothetical protein